MSSEWKARRFWKAAEVQPVEGGFGVTLDGRPVRTPQKAPLTLPTRRAAEAVAAEWDAQEGVINPLSMPVTRAANAAVDKVAPQRDEVVAMLAAYGETDLICYRAAGPEALVERQAEAWDALIDWAEARFGARLIPVEGLIPAPQSARALDRLAAPLREMTEFQLTGMHDLVSLSGSLVIGLAAVEEAFAAETLWRHSRIDETWQEEQWGIDAEAAEMAETRRKSFLAALDFYRLVTEN